MILPRYPVYVPSKGRWNTKGVFLTARFLKRDRVPFHLVVEPQEADDYARAFGEDQILVLPFSNLGMGSTPARNWCWEHALEHGAARHWVIDDNIQDIKRTYKKWRLPCVAGPALASVEDFTDRYENIAVSGLNYKFFITAGAPAYFLNVHVYSCMLIDNSLPHRWRLRLNEDTDLCLQVLADDWCTVLINVFGIEKATTMTMKGGNMDELYQGDGRLKMARSLEAVWPGIVRVGKRFGRAQHVVAWDRFQQPLRLKEGIDLDALPRFDEYGLRLRAVKPVKHPRLRQLLEEYELARSA